MKGGFGTVFNSPCSSDDPVAGLRAQLQLCKHQAEPRRSRRIFSESPIRENLSNDLLKDGRKWRVEPPRKDENKQFLEMKIAEKINRCNRTRNWVAASISIIMQSVVASPANELLLKFRDGPESLAAATGHALVGAEVVRTFREVGWQKVKLPAGMNVDEAMAAYKGLESVLTVEPNGVIRAEMREDQGGFVEHYDFAQATAAPVIPNDPQFGGQWALRKIGATNAWAITKGSRDIVVAILDTGVNYKHEDLRENMWRNPGETGIDEHGKDKATNGIDDDENGYADDVHGIDPAGNDSDPMDEGVLEPRIYHGTFVAGQIAAVGNNGKGICGINWTAQVMAIRISQVNDVFRAADVLEAFDYVVKMKRRGVNIRVTNNSYGGDNPGEAIRDAMEIAGKEGVLHVCSLIKAGGEEAVDR